MNKNAIRLFFVLFLGITVLILTSSGSASFSIQELRYNVKYECNGETIVVGHCRADDDQPGMPRTQPSADYCMVYYPSRPKSGGFTVQKVELRSDVLRKLTACNALTPPAPVSAPTTEGDESSAEAEYELGRKYFAAKDYERAAAAFKRAIAIEPATAPYTNLGNTYRALDRNEDAVAAYKEALRLDPDNDIAYFGLGDADNELKRYEPAVKAFLAVLRLKPKYPNASNQLGLSYFYQNRYQDAAAAFEDALRLKPNDGNALFNLGLLQLRTGHADEALRSERRLETLDKKLAEQLFNEINKSKGRAPHS